MSGIRISQLPNLGVVTDDDNLIINDGNANTSRITYASFKAGLSNDLVSVSSVNSQTGDVIITASSINAYTITEVDTALSTKATYSLIGVPDGAQDLGNFVSGIIPVNSTVFGALQALETAVDGVVNEDGLLATDNTWTGLNTFEGKILSGAENNLIAFYFANQSDFPSATDYHGAVAHSHADGSMYFAHGGAWNRLANASDITGATDLSDTYTLIGVSQGELDLGTFTNNPSFPSSVPQISDNASIKVALQDLNNAVISNNQLTVASNATQHTLIGVLSGDTDLGVFSGSTITDNSSVKTAIQELETAVEGVGGFSGSYNDLTDTPTLGSAAATDATDYATAAQGALADTALQPAAVGVSVQGYDANTVVDADYATVQSGAAAGTTAVQASADAITVTTLPTDGTATVDTLAAAINTLTGELAAILNA